MQAPQDCFEERLTLKRYSLGSADQHLLLASDNKIRILLLPSVKTQNWIYKSPWGYTAAVGAGIRRSRLSRTHRAQPTTSDFFP